MKPLLKQYLAWGIAAQFLAASAVYIGGLIFINCYGNMGVKLPAITSMIISIGPWAFLWPFAVWLSAVILLDKVRTERMLLHLFGSMMVAAVIILVVVSVDFALPFMGVLVVDVGNNGE